MAKHMGPLVEKVIGQVAQAPKYQSIPSNLAKAELIRNILPSLREQARAQAYSEDQTAEIRLKLKRLPQRQRALIEEIAKQRGHELNLP